MHLTSPYLILFSLIPTLTIATPTHPQNNGLRSMHFSLYFHDIFNKTEFMIYNGIAGPKLTLGTAPLGSIFVLNGPLTITTNPSSDQVGTIEMMIATHTTDGRSGIAATKFNLNLKSGHGGSIALAGVTPYGGSGDNPVAGGTGDFLFVQGPPLTAVTSPLGGIFALKDPLTITPNPSSDQLGTIEMMVVTHTTNGRSGIGSTKVNLNLKSGHRGSIVLVGVTSYDGAARDNPVAGGTGDFLFVQGHVVSSLVSVRGLRTIFKFDFHLFWPPYAPYNH